MTCNTGSINFSAYAVRKDESQLVLTLINKEPLIPAAVKISSTSPCRRQLYATYGAVHRQQDRVTFGGSSVSAEGRWEPRQMEFLRMKHGATEVDVPAASAAVIQLKPSS